MPLVTAPYKTAILQEQILAMYSSVAVGIDCHPLVRYHTTPIK